MMTDIVSLLDITTIFGDIDNFGQLLNTIGDTCLIS